ncbi:MAG: hypothetical protein CL862_05660 [Cyanobium sp. NAT70]|nr:hypothetical protein [Cyanobium sp. NAT70]|tara:strand:- start:1806 stop:2030 length:225 start_codon:yes stop_codon:yes gene_type:complete
MPLSEFEIAVGGLSSIPVLAGLGFILEKRFGVSPETPKKNPSASPQRQKKVSPKIEKGSVEKLPNKVATKEKLS